MFVFAIVFTQLYYVAALNLQRQPHNISFTQQHYTLIYAERFNIYNTDDIACPLTSATMGPK